jgi:rRNA-processing protein FCF1
LVTAMKFKVDFFSALKGNRLFVLEKAMEELENIAKGRGKDATAAKVALYLIRSKKLEVLEADLDVDDALLLYGKRGYRVATQDVRLKRRLKKENIKLIYLRQKKYVKIE